MSRHNAPKQTAKAIARCTASGMLALLLLVANLATPAIAQSLDQPADQAAKPELRVDNPGRYVVQEGDTLWGIASRFLKDPWRWPLIWQNNPSIENPHRIFPGDLLVVTGQNRDQLKVVRLKPRIRHSELDRGIPAIPPDVIDPFLTAPIIVEPGELDESGYVLQGVEDEIILGKYTKFYARELEGKEAEEFNIFHVSETLVHPETGEPLGVETKQLGEARMLRPVDSDDESNISKLVVIDANEEIGPGDRLLAKPDFTPLPYYEPHAAPAGMEGWIIRAPKGVREAGRFDIVIVSGGTREGMEPGHVLRAMVHREPRKDPITGDTVALPDESSGLMMVFRVYEKVSYALVMEANRQISVGDRYVDPARFYRNNEYIEHTVDYSVETNDPSTSNN